MNFVRPLDLISQTPSTIPVLRALYELPPGFRTSGREIARRAGVSHPAALRVLNELLAQAMVLVQRLPKRDLYELNREHTLVKRLIPLLEWEPRARDELINFLKSRFQRQKLISMAYLFGSAAEGTLSAESDIDVLIVSREGAEKVEEFLEQLDSDLRKRYGNRLSPIIVELDSAEFLKRAPRKKLWAKALKNGIHLHQEAA